MARRDAKVARRYAKALLELWEPSKLESVRDGLLAFSRAWTTDAELRGFLLNPAASMKERSEALKAVAAKIPDGGEMLQNGLLLLLENRRLSLLPEIVSEFATMVAELRKLFALEVTSAFALPEADKEALRTRLEKDFGSMVSISWRRDESLIGGLVVKSGDRLLDGSVRGALAQAKASLL